MLNALKNIGFIFLVMVISIGIYWFLYLDKSESQDALDHALNILGEKLLAMVPEKEGREDVEITYKQFREKADQQKVTPESIEKMAAVILNLSNEQKELTPEQAKEIIRASQYAAVLAPAGPGGYLVSGKAPEITKLPEPPSPEALEDLGERIRIIAHFNQEFNKELEAEHEEKLKEFQFTIDNDLRIRMDRTLKNRIGQREYQQLARELKALEKQKILVWKSLPNDSFQNYWELHSQQLDTLQKLQEFHNQFGMSQFNFQTEKEKLKNLNIEIDNPCPEIEPDSVIVTVTTSTSSNPSVSTSGSVAR